jgi:guanosine-3',5'-bis(diphosphate) 3'-pyrophosphohydrolase
MAQERTSVAGLQEADHLFAVIVERVRQSHENVDENRLRQAYEMALVAHEGQYRLDGSAYVTHPLEVAELCADLNMDEDALIAAILHDTVEDTSVRLAQIRQLFGQHVASMVDSLTKIKKIDFFARFLGRDKASSQARNLQKLFIAMTRDTRVIVIKLCDRLHNLHTLAAMPAHKQQRIARETLEFYIPLTRRLGLGQMAVEMEDLVFQYLYPEEYAQLEAEVNEVAPRYEKNAEEMIAEVKVELEKHGIKIQRIYGRRKHLWSIFQKMRKQHVGLDGIYDLAAIRLIIDGMAEDCYRVMGLLHLRYKPIFHRFRDFVASPKENGYQTLHTTVIGPGGTMVECQIRTVEMDLEAQKGVAAHWRYKDYDHTSNPFRDESWMDFIRELAEEEVESDEFVARARDTLLGDQALVLSPKGEVVELPAGSTPIDFAYYIHTDLGHAIRSAKVNGAVVPLDYTLRNGDIVEVLKADDGDTAPRPEWLVMARSPKSLLKVRRYFKTLPVAEREVIGRRLLRQQIIKEGLYPLNLTANDKLLALLKRLKVRSINDLYDKVALGAFSSEEIIRELKDIHRAKTGLESEQAIAKRAQAGTETGEQSLVGSAADIGICKKGGEPLRAKAVLMECCTPIPDDNIYGIYDRRDRRIKVHRVNCEILQRELGEGELVELEWDLGREERFYPVRIQLVSLNRVGLLFEILRYLSQANVNLGGAVFGSPPGASSDRNAQFELVLEVADIEQLEACVAVIAGIDDVIEVTRAFKYAPLVGPV